MRFRKSITLFSKTSVTFFLTIHSICQANIAIQLSSLANSVSGDYDGNRGVTMTIEIMDKGTILVSLKKEDMRTYSLNFDENTSGCPENGLKRLLYHVGETCGLDHKGKSYLIEALPSSDGCLLIISVRKAKYRKKYRIKRSKGADAYVFFDCDAMLDYCRLYRGDAGYAVYRYKERYILIPSRASDGAFECLCEYAERCSLSDTAIAHIREFGQLLREKELQRRHIGGRTVAVRDTALRHGGG